MGEHNVRKARDLVGLPVIDLEQGEHVGEVRDVLFSAEGEMHAFLLEKSGLLSVGKIVTCCQVHSIGQDAVTIKSRSDIQEFRDDTGLIRSLIEGDVHFVGKDVLTQNGSLLGRVEDVYIDDELHTIVGYEISEGFLVDIREGRKAMRAHPEIMIGADALLVPDDTEIGEI